MNKQAVDRIIKKYRFWDSISKQNLSKLLKDLKKSTRTEKLSIEVIEYIQDQVFMKTPKSLIEFMVDIASLKRGYVVLDPVCGTGQFLIKASEEEKALKLYGIDINPEIIEWAKFFADQKSLNIHYFNQNSLKPFPKEIPQADIIFSSLPFGSKVLDQKIINSFSVKTKSLEGLLLQKILQSLKEGGAAFVVIPDGFLFRKYFQDLRKYITEEVSLEAIISLPQGAFAPFTNISTSILVIKKSKLQKYTLLLRAINIESLPLLSKEYKNFLKGKKVELGEKVKDFTNRENWSLKRYFEEKELEELFEKVVPKKNLVELKDVAIIKNSNLKDLRNKIASFDLILANRFTPGKIYTSLESLKSKSDTAYYFAVKAKKEKILAMYLYYLMKTNLFKEQIKICQTGMYIPYIRIGCLKKIKIPIASLDEQKRIIDLAEKAISYIDDQKLKIELIERRLSENIFEIEKISKEIFQSKIIQDNPFDKLPRMIAFPYKAFKNTTNLDKKYDFLKVCFEITLKTIGMMIILAVKNIFKARKKINKINPNKPISDGTWILIILENLDFLIQSECFISDHINEIDGDKLEFVINGLNKLRIDEAHPFSALNDFQKGEVVEEFGNLLEDFIKEFIFLTKYPLVYFQSVSKKHGKVSHIVEYLIGDAQTSKEDKLLLEEIFNSELYFYSSSFGRSLLLSPLIIYEDCPKCKCKEIFFFDFIEKGVPKYGGCLKRIKRAFPEYLEEIKKIFS